MHDLLTMTIVNRKLYNKIPVTHTINKIIKNYKIRYKIVYI